MSTKVNDPKPMTAEAELAIAYLERISELLKHQRRHFDDAVVVHCIRLVQDYVEDNLHEVNADAKITVGDGRRS
jgi:hypothetical protein